MGKFSVWNLGRKETDEKHMKPNRNATNGLESMKSHEYAPSQTQVETMAIF